MRKLIASVALVTAVAVGGLAVAAVNPLQLVSAKSSQATTAAEKDTGKAKAARRAVADKLLDQALAGVVEKGTITKAQAAAVKQAIQDTAKRYKADHKGQGKGKAKAKIAALRKGLRRGIVTTSAEAIGVTPKALVADLKSGKSIAQAAQAKNVDPQTVVTAIVNAGNTKTDAAVTAGKIDAARAAKIKQRLPELATKAVNRVPRHQS